MFRRMFDLVYKGPIFGGAYIRHFTVFNICFYPDVNQFYQEHDYFYVNRREVF